MIDITFKAPYLSEESRRHLEFAAVSAGTSGIEQIAEAGAGYVTFSLGH